MYYVESLKNLVLTILSCVLAAATVLATFALIEPVITGAQGESVDITVTQQINTETSFTSDPQNVAMDTAIGGITGGSSQGTSTFAVQTNNPAGYNVTISFADDPAMQATGSAASIPDYSQTTPDWSFVENAAGGSAAFAYAVHAASAGEIATAFEDDGSSTCGSGGNNTYPTASQGCWVSPSTGNVTILSSSGITSGPATSSVLFRVHVPASPSPGVEAGGYVATATLTVADN